MKKKSAGQKPKVKLTAKQQAALYFARKDRRTVARKAAS